MSFLDMFRSPGRKLTAAEDLEINGQGETFAEEMIRIAKENRDRGHNTQVSLAYNAALEDIAEHASDGLEYFNFAYHYSGMGEPQRRVVREVAAKIKGLGFKATTKKKKSFDDGWIIDLKELP